MNVLLRTGRQLYFARKWQNMPIPFRVENFYVFGIDIQQRFYAKKLRGATGGKLVMDTQELNQVLNLNEINSTMQAEIDRFKEDLIRELSLRSSTLAFEQLQVTIPSENNKVYPLNHLARVSLKNPQLAIINLESARHAIQHVALAIANSGLNVSPQQQGNVLYVPLPKITREHREKLAKSAKNMCNKCHERLREVQQAYLRKLRKMEGKSENLVYSAQKYMEQLTRDYFEKADILMKAKQKELLEELK